MIRDQKGMSMLNLLITIIVLLILGAISITVIVNGEVFAPKEEEPQVETVASARGEINKAIQDAVKEVQEVYYADQLEEIQIENANTLAEKFVQLVNDVKTGGTASIYGTAIEEATSVTINVKDDEADVVRTITISTEEGSDLITVRRLACSIMKN